MTAKVKHALMASGCIKNRKLQPKIRKKRGRFNAQGMSVYHFSLFRLQLVKLGNGHWPQVGPEKRIFSSIVMLFYEKRIFFLNNKRYH